MRLVTGCKRQVGINRNVVNGTHHIFTKRRLIAVNFPSKALLVPLFFQVAAGSYYLVMSFSESSKYTCQLNNLQRRVE